MHFSAPLFVQIRVGSYSTAVTHLDPKVEQLEADVDVVGDEFIQLIDKVPAVNFPLLIRPKLHQKFCCVIAILLNYTCGLLLECCRRCFFL